jgi:hypothetical protein
MSFDKHRNEDGTWNGVGVLSELSGLDAAAIASIAGEVKANQERLSTCAWHDFELHEAKALTSRSKFRCKHCEGVINGEQYRWHELGRRPQP